VSTAQDAAAAGADAAKQRIAFLRIVLLALAAAGLVVGGILIANTFTIVLTQRSRELAVLRAAGATGRQVFASVLGEAALVGVAGAAAGSAAGIGVAHGLRALAQLAGLALPTGPLTVTAGALGISTATGVLVTVLAALVPARRAARIAPVEAMRASDSAPAATRRARRITGQSIAGLGVVALVVAGVLHSIPGVALGAALLLVGLAILGPVLTPPLARTIGRPLAALGAPGRLARDSTVRNPRRTTATTTALALGLTLISFVAVLGGSVKAITADSGDAVTADLIVQSSGGEMLGALSPDVRTRIAGLPEVAVASPARFGHWLDDGTADALTAIDPATLPRVADLRMTAGRLDALQGGGIVLAAGVAHERRLQVGDELPMTFPRDGEQRLRVVGLMADASAQALSTSYVVSLDEYRRHYSENVDAAVYVALAPGVGEAEGRRAVQSAVAGFPNADVLDQRQAADRRAAAVDQVLGLITVLLAFAVLIALLGVTNTLALSIVERTREIGLLRAVGMTRAQLSRMVRAEAVLIAAVAVTSGAVLGVGLAAATMAGLASGVPFVLEIPVVQLLAVVAATVLAGLVAGLVPARRAARLDVLTAIATL
jgi:putative ABC transport system permease protein